MDIDSPPAAAQPLPSINHDQRTPTGPSRTTASPSEPQPTTPTQLTHTEPVPSEHSPSQVSASRATAATEPDNMDTDIESPALATQTDTQHPLALGSGHVSAAASVTAADDAEHNDNTSISSGASVGPASQVSNGLIADVHVAGADESPDGMDRFLRRVEMEKKIAQLQQRLELASIKTNHGWSDMTIKEIETRLPKQSLSQRPPIIIPNGNGPTYEPPSPSRPWQLADVLWQPLPRPGAPRPYASRPSPHASSHTPSHSLPGGLPSIASLGAPPNRGPPVSPGRQRLGMDDYLARSTLSPLRGYNSHPPNGHGRPTGGGGHRRASSAITSHQFLSTDPYPPPSSAGSRPKKSPKKRSQSQSNLRDRPTTQDVDAARALTFMLESGRSPVAPGPDRRRESGPASASAITPGSGWPSGGPPTQHFPLPPLGPPSQQGPPAGLPSPFSDMPPPRPRAQSFMDHDRHMQGPMSRPHLPPPPLMPAHAFGPPKGHMGHNRGASMDSAPFGGRSFWRRSPDRDREREMEREREREREMRQHHHERMQEDDLMRREDDQAAAELMMFLAHSPSPVRPKRNSADGPSFAGTARVLFSDMPPRGTDRSAGAMGPPLSVRR